MYMVPLKAVSSSAVTKKKKKWLCNELQVHRVSTATGWSRGGEHRNTAVPRSKEVQTDLKHLTFYGLNGDKTFSKYVEYAVKAPQTVVDFM